MHADSLTLDGLDAGALAARLRLPAVELRARVASTMDVAHDLAAAGSAAGTIVLAQTQDGGRGRAGKRWTSPSGGLWFTLIERPRTTRGLEVLSLRVGLALATALDALAGERVGLKWPNDLHLRAGKLAGILVEARWRDLNVEWVAIGVGLNIVAPSGVYRAAGLRAGATRLSALEAIIPVLRAATACEGPLAGDELARFEGRDVARGRRVIEPLAGVVLGVRADGELMIETATGPMACRAGSMVFAEER